MSSPKQTSQKVFQVTSARLDDGAMIEAVRDLGRTQLLVFQGGHIRSTESLLLPDGSQLVSIPASNALVRHHFMLLPADAVSFASLAGLVAEIAAYLRAYVDLSPGFEQIASYYVLLSWIYDAFNELPYLRVRGDFGSGKTRALSVIGSVCYTPFFASGASSVSPIFHILDTYRGTLVYDEADFRFSDEKADVIKILNNGNVRGFPVLRTMTTSKGEMFPRAFNVYGPKLIGMRDSFDDIALESRFITEDMGHRSLRLDIPINLPDTYKAEALALRNKLLMFRFQYRDKVRIQPEFRSELLSARLNQILLPLLSLVEDETTRTEMVRHAAAYEARLLARRADQIEARVVKALRQLFSYAPGKPVSVGNIVTRLLAEDSELDARPITHRYIGSVLRNRLRLTTYKTNGVYVVPVAEYEKVKQLAKRYGVAEGAGA